MCCVVELYLVKGMAGSVSRTRKYVRENAFSKKNWEKKVLKETKQSIAGGGRHRMSSNP